MSTENEKTETAEKPKVQFSDAMQALEPGDRIVYLENNFTYKGEVLKIEDKDGNKELTFQPDKVNGHPKAMTLILNQATVNKVDPLFSYGVVDKQKRNREFSYLEVKQAISDGKIYGLSYSEIAQRNVNSLMAGNRTEVLKNISFSYTSDEGTRAITADARVELTRDPKGQLKVMHTKAKEELNLNEPFYGKEFSTAQKKQLLETGTLGLVDDFTNTKTGEVYKMWVGLDHELKRPMARPAFAMKEDQIYGTKLNKKDAQAWVSGKPVTLDSVGQDKKTRVYIANGASRSKYGVASYSLEKAQELGIVKDPNAGKKNETSQAEKTSQSTSRGQSR